MKGLDEGDLNPLQQFALSFIKSKYLPFSLEYV